MTMFNEDAYFTLKALQKGPPTKKEKSITKLELTKN